MTWSLQDWIRPEVLELDAYHVAPQAGLTKLDAMENPYDWPPELVESWLAEMRSAGSGINRYPDPRALALCDRIRANMAVPAEFDIVLGNGSDELIQLLAMATATPGASICTPVPGFVMYGMIARFVGVDFHAVELDREFDLDVSALRSVLEQQRPSLLFLAMPNNPTGNLFSEDRLHAVISAAPGLVVLDEAYTAFTDADYLPLLGEYPNVVVMRTLSKVGLAGLRLGILIGRPELLAEVDKLRLPYNINLLTQMSASHALDNYEVFRQQASNIRAERAWLEAELDKLGGLSLWPSEANFILARCDSVTAKALHLGLLEAGILVKNLHGSHPRLAECLRFTVGTRDQNRQLVDSLALLLG